MMQIEEKFKNASLNAMQFEIKWSLESRVRFPAEEFWFFLSKHQTVRAIYCHLMTILHILQQTV